MTLVESRLAGHATAAAWLHHLVGRETVAAPPPPATHDPLEGSEWTALLGAVVDGRITESLLDATVTGELPATVEQLDAAADAHRIAMGLALVLERRLLDVQALLATAGVDVIVLKGPAVAHLDWDDANQRDFGDVDILVRSDQAATALRTLERAGHQRPVPPARPILDRVFAKGATLLDPTGYEIDVHRTLTPGRFGLLIDEDALWADREAFVLAGTTLHALDAGARLAHTAAHQRLGSPMPRLSTVRDLLRQVGQVPVDVGAHRADALGLTAVLVAALRHVVDERYELPAEWTDWLAAVRLDPDDEQRLAEHDAAGGEYRAQAWGSLREVPWRWRGVVVLSWLHPSRAHLAARELDRRTYLRDRLLRRRPA